MYLLSSWHEIWEQENIKFFQRISGHMLVQSGDQFKKIVLLGESVQYATQGSCYV